MWRTCGRHPLDPLGVERPALLDPEAVLLVDHAEAEPGEADGGSISAWVPTISPSSPLASRSRASAPHRRGRRAGQQRERRGLLGQQPAEGHSRAARRASRSAPSAPPGGRLRAPAASRRRATTVLPEPTSPISSRCIGSPESRSASMSSKAPQLVAGRLEGQRLDPALDRSRRAGRSAAPAGPARCARLRVARSAWWRKSSSKPSRSRACSTSSWRLGKVGGPDRVADAGQAAAARAARPAAPRPRWGPTERTACSSPLADPLGLQLLGRGVDRDAAL